MSARLCVKCGYDLSGLPKEGTVVTCPECRLATDLSIPPPVRGNMFAPLFWAISAVALCAVCVALMLWVGAPSEKASQVLLLTGLLGGAIIAGVRMYKAIGRQLETDLEPLAHGLRPVLAMIVGIVSIIMHTAVVLCLLSLLLDVVRK